MLFQGQEFSASSPFLYFARSRRGARRGRARAAAPNSSRSFRASRSTPHRQPLDDPADARTFATLQTRLRGARRPTRPPMRCTAICLRCGGTAQPSAASAPAASMAPCIAAIGVRASLLRRRHRRRARCSIVNLGSDFKRPSIAEPLVAPPADRDWVARVVERGSALRRYGGTPTLSTRASGACQVNRRSCSRRRPGAARVARESQAPHRMKEPSRSGASRGRRPIPRARMTLATREWLVTNGLGGYASGTIAGVITRRYHGCLIAALPAPLGRMVMLSHVARADSIPGRPPHRGRRPRATAADSQPRTPATSPSSASKRGCRSGATTSTASSSRCALFLTHLQNTVRVMYELVDGASSVELGLRPSVNFRAQEAPVSEPLGWPYEFRAIDERYEIALKDSPLPPLRLVLQAERRHVHAEGQAHRQRALSGRGAPRLSGAGHALESRLLPSPPRQGRARDSRRIDRTVRGD